MKKYNNFFGIDVAKNDFVVACHGQKKVKSYANNHLGIDKFIKDQKKLLKQSLIVLETTGGYEWDLIVSLTKHKLAVHRADTVKVKHYIRSLRRYGKTDMIDAHALALYAFERHAMLGLFRKPDKKQLRLQLLVRRRDELVKMKVQETNRAQSPMNSLLKSTFKTVLNALEKAIENVEKDIKKLIESDPWFQGKKEVMCGLEGISDKTSNKLLALMPEFGRTTRKSIAHLAGVAPHPHDSGKLNGYRKTRGGRQDVKKALFMAALAASRSEGRLGDYYRALVTRGKKKMVALIALMRKMVIIINARIRDYIAANQNMCDVTQ